MQHLCSNANGIIYNIALYITLLVSIEKIIKNLQYILPVHLSQTE